MNHSILKKHRLYQILTVILMAALFAGLPLPPDTAASAADSANPTEPPAGVIDIQPNQPVSGTLSAIDASNWYSVTIPTRGKTRLIVESGGMMAPVFYTDYFHGKAAALQPKLSKIVSPYFRLPAGTYYIQMKSNAGVEAATSYGFTFEYTAEGTSASESEWNDTKDTAGALPLKQTLSGNLYDGIDTDWYKIETAKTGTVRLTFTRDTSVNADYANSFTYGSKTVSFGTAKVAYTEKTVTAIINNVPAGTSYIRIASSGSYANTNDYKLKAEFFPGDGDANLKSISKSTGKISPKFDKNKTSYTLKLASSAAAVKITPKTASAKSKLAIKNGGSFKAAKNVTVKLNKGQTKTVTIRVTAEDKVTVKTYTIKVSRAK